MSEQDTATPILKTDSHLEASILTNIPDILAKLDEARANGDMADIVAAIQGGHVKIEDDKNASEKAEKEAKEAEKLVMATDAENLITALLPEFLKVFLAEDVEQRVLALAERDTRISGFNFYAEISRTPATEETLDDGSVVGEPATVSLDKAKATLYRFVRKGATTSTTSNTSGEASGQGAPKPMTVSVNGVEREFANAQDARREYLTIGGSSRKTITDKINALDGHQVINP